MVTLIYTLGGMKLGEALSERARLQRKIGELRTRINANTHAREGEEIAEDPNELLAEAIRTTKKLEALIVRINMANATNRIEDRPITEWLAIRDTLASLAATYNGAAEAAQLRDRSGIFGRQGDLPVELKVDVPALRAKAEESLNELRRVDNRVQAANWTTDV